MAQRTIVQPNGKFAIFSSIVDNFVAYDMTREEVIQFFVDEAIGRTRREAEQSIEHATSWPGRFESAIETIQAVHGKEEAEKMKTLLSAPGKEPLGLKESAD